jgi:acyl-coenzyme A synthetase/AMP-(fatty) acid ligase
VTASAVEYFVNQHEVIFESVIIIVPDENRGESTHDSIVLKDAHIIHKISEVVHFIEEFTRMSVGKI